ncbi:MULTISPECIES: rRNA adenine N-6-methyltransferase family protein [Clostridium]|uniref:Methyltransferase n=1 Tax=Clostridium cibarium TaxID=2762247 RepID=A0ABR8PQ10_9CLOT|nr:MULTISPECIES: rRNA adenine N-6-methyltransferase family protein [Clostridium]MBD7910253.1 methyltransferase [Clostridium cibarium]
MRPYEGVFIASKIEEYNLLINEAKSGECSISKREGIKEGYLYEKDEEIKTRIPELLQRNKLSMRVGPKEIQGCYEAIKWAKGKVAIVGLGLGYLAQEMSKKKDVKEVIVYEINSDVIKLYNRNFSQNEKIKIIEGDAYKATKQKFDFFFVDIYGYELSLRVVEDYIKFNEIHEIQEYSFWGMEHFLLSCSYEEIVWVYIPELWMEMSKDISRELEKSGYMDYYKQLDEKLVSEVLAAFKVVLNEGEDE